MKFNDLYINDRIKKALNELNFDDLTQIQEEAMPHIFDGYDVVGCAQTGTGKTAAFTIPLINNILKEQERFKIRGLIVVPTRELAIQIHENIMSFSKFTNIRSLALFGGIKESFQKQKLNQGVDIVIATPGRLIDFIKQKSINLKQVNCIVLDEADRMLDMGFVNDINKIISSIPRNRQTLMFSATMTNQINEMCNSFQNDPIEVSVNSNTTVNSIKHDIYFIEQTDKLYLLKDIIKYNRMENVLVFCRTKQQAQSTSNFLRGNNITSDSIHKDKTQIERKKALNDFKNKNIKALVATDIASRGLDIDNLFNVINFDMPNDIETYIHRSGRTARNFKNGITTTFCNPNEIVVFERIKEECKVDFNILKHKYKNG